VVIDAPAGFAAHGRLIDRLVEHVDDLLVATDVHAPGTRPLVRYLDAIVRGRIVGDLPASLRVHVVPTGTPAAEYAPVRRRVHTVPVVDAVPALWGRNATISSVALDDMPEPLVELARTLAA